jgi:hypothetical protein
MRSSHVTVYALIAACLFSSIARPSPAHSAPDLATEARIHFRTGIRLVKKGKLQEALERFLLANRLAPNPNVTFNIALCLDKLKRYREAFIYYRQLLEHPSKLNKADLARVEGALDRILPKVARVRVITEPTGATIYLDRKNLGSYGKTPRTLAVTPGEHRIILEKPGHEPSKIEVRAVRGERVTVRTELKRIVGHVTIKSKPPGAKIWIDDETETPSGTTPFEASLPPGRHTITAKAEGYWTGRVRLVVHRDRHKELTIELRPLPPPKSTLTVLCNVTGAVVELDGRFGGLAPLVRRDLAPGEHVISVSHKGYLAWKRTVRLEADEETTVSVQLARVPKRMRRGALPWVMLGATGVSLVAATVLVGLAHKNHQDYMRDPAPTYADLQKGERLNISADVLLGVTALSGAATAISFLLTQPDPKSESVGNVLTHDQDKPTVPKESRPKPGEKARQQEETTARNEREAERDTVVRDERARKEP